MQSEATTIPCSGPSTLPSERMPRPATLPTILPPALPSDFSARELRRISFRLLTLNLAFWLLAGLAVARSCGH